MMRKLKEPKEYHHIVVSREAVDKIIKLAKPHEYIDQTVDRILGIKRNSLKRIESETL